MRALEAIKTGEQKVSPASSENRTIGGYQCIVKGDADVVSGKVAADLVVVVLHGFGANNTDFASLPGIVSSASSGELAARKILYVFPAAGIHPALGASAWWHIDVMGFMRLPSAGEAEIARFIRAEPDGLAEARVRISTLIDEVREIAGGGAGMIASKRVILGGFSQGAITSLDAALHRSTADQLVGVPR